MAKKDEIKDDLLDEIFLGDAEDNGDIIEEISKVDELKDVIEGSEDKITGEDIPELNEEEIELEKKQRLIDICEEKIKCEAELIQCDGELAKKAIQFVHDEKMKIRKRYDEASDLYTKELQKDPQAVSEATRMVDIGKYRIRTTDARMQGIQTGRILIEKMKRMVKTFQIEDKGGFDGIKIR